MFIRKSALDKVGLFDENIFMYGEDLDLNFRIREQGYNIKSIPQAKIYHYFSKSSNILNKYKNAFRGTYYVFFKYFGKKTFFIYLDTKLTFLRKALVALLVGNKQKAKQYFEVMKINKEKYLEREKDYLNKNL